MRRPPDQYTLTYLATACAQEGYVVGDQGVTKEGPARWRTDFTAFHESGLRRLKGDILAHVYGWPT